MFLELLPSPITFLPLSACGCPCLAKGIIPSEEHVLTDCPGVIADRIQADSLLSVR